MSLFSLQGKRALVTGATGGIGEAIVRALHGQGATVGLSGTRRETLERLAADLGQETAIFPAALDKPEGPASLIDAVQQAWGGLDILVNNAGVTRDGLMMRMKDADWDYVMQVNLRAVFQLCRESLRPMLKQKYGRIINITSIVGSIGNPGQANYVASKAGMIGMGKALAQEVASRNVTVNAIAPGFIASPMTAGLPQAHQEKLIAGIPMGRMGIGADIAAGVVYLASEAAAYVTGQTLHINGGMAML